MHYTIDMSMSSLYIEAIAEYRHSAKEELERDWWMHVAVMMN